MNMMNVAIVMFSVLGLTYCAITCKVDTDGTVADEVCDDAITRCQSPIFTEYTGVITGKLQCGVCVPSSDCSTCTSSSETNSCNIPVDMTDVKTFKCYDWEMTDSVWTQSETTTSCSVITESLVCNAPDYDIAKVGEYTKQLNGCGPCLADEKSDGHCNECTGTLCNSSSFLTGSLILAVLSAFVFLM